MKGQRAYECYQGGGNLGDLIQGHSDYASIHGGTLPAPESLRGHDSALR